MQSWVLAGRGIRLSGAWCAPIGIGAYQWRWGLMVAVYGMHLLLLGLIDGVCSYGGCWHPPGAVRAGVAYGGAWRTPGKASACCTGHVCWLYVK